MVQLIAREACTRHPHGVLEEGIGKINDRVAVDIVHRKIRQDVTKEEEEPTAVDDLYIPEDGHESEEQCGGKEKSRNDKYEKGVEVIAELVGAIMAFRLPADDRAQCGSQPGARDHSQTGKQNEHKGTQEPAPEIAGLCDGVGEIIFLGVVFEIAIERCAHDG